MSTMQPTKRSVAALAALSLLLSLIAGFPALGGGRILDDVYSAPSPTTDELRDAGDAFRRTSIDYQRAARTDADDADGVTYRPITMHSLVTSQALFGTMPAHHVVSLVLHALTAFLVGLVLLRAGKPSYVAALGAGLVAAHPALVEGWVWVAGRADLLAGFCVALVAIAFPARPGGITWPRFALGAIALFSGVLAKETFVFVGPAIAMRSAFAGGTKRAKIGRALIALVPLVAGVLVWERIRAASPVGIGPEDVLAWLRRTPRLLGDATATLVLPWGRPMRSLAYELTTQTGATTLLGTAVLGLGLASTIAEKRWALTLVLLGSACSLIPVAHIADAYWLGFDRNLTMPLVAVTIAALESLEVPATLSLPTRIAGLAALFALAGVASLGSSAYASERALTRAMRDARPTDPSGFLAETARLTRLGRTSEAARILERAPESSAPALERERALRWIALRFPAKALSTLDAISRARPDDPFVAADALTLALARHRFSELPDLADLALERRASRRRGCETLEHVRPSMASIDASDRRPYDRAYRTLRCATYVRWDERAAARRH